MNEDDKDNVAAGATAVGAGMMMLPPPASVVGAGIMAAGMLYTAYSGKKKKKKLAQQQEARARELQRRANKNAELLMRKTRSRSQAAEISFAKGGVAMEGSALQSVENIVTQGQEQADRMKQEAEYGAAQMHLQAENIRSQARDEARAGYVGAVTTTGKTYGATSSTRKEVANSKWFKKHGWGQ
jgi:hypothetical protein